MSRTSKTRVGIINVTGYAGVEMARLLYRHPGVELASVTGRSAAGQKLDTVFPHLASQMTIEAELGQVDLAFSAMPHKESAEIIIPLINSGIKVVDISADFRLKDAKSYPTWYGFVHPAPQLLSQAVYGLTELYRKQVAAAQLVANPGCYPTGAILALAPAVKEGIIEPDIIIDSKSGVSGAGRSLSLQTHFSEVNEDVSAYSLSGHRHLPEIIQEISLLGFKSPSVTFVPHLIPMTRGILTTAYAPLVSRKIAAGEKGEKEGEEERQEKRERRLELAGRGPRRTARSRPKGQGRAAHVARRPGAHGDAGRAADPGADWHRGARHLPRTRAARRHPQRVRPQAVHAPGHQGGPTAR